MRIRTKIVIPEDAMFDFIGNGLRTERGQIVLDAGAGFGFNEWGRLILSVLEGGGIAFVDDKLCINACEVASRIAGTGLKVQDCKLSIDPSQFTRLLGCALKIDEHGRLAVDSAALAGTGLTVQDCIINVDTKKLAPLLAGDGIVATPDGKLNNAACNLTPDPARTVVIPVINNIVFRHRPNGYGYNMGIEVEKTASSLTVLYNHVGVCVGVVPGEPVVTIENFDLTQPPVGITDREDTPESPNFYSGGTSV